MHNVTHARITKRLFPHIPTKTINTMNHAIDHPTLMSRSIQGIVDKNKFGSFGPEKWGHRRFGHDLSSSALLALAMGQGSNGIMAAYSHLMEDMFNDQIRRAWGSSGAKLFEAAFNYTTDVNRRRRRHY
jgi:hypothetical protein